MRYAVIATARADRRILISIAIERVLVGRE
jgi:hypothetical protein